MKWTESVAQASQRNRHLSGIVRPDYQRAPRSDRTRLADVRQTDRLHLAQRFQEAALLRRGADRDAARSGERVSEYRGRFVQWAAGGSRRASRRYRAAA